MTCFTAWQCLQASLAGRFECEPDEIGILEDDDGVERLSLRGAVIGYVTTEIGGITFGIPDAPSIVPEDPSGLATEDVSAPALDA